MEGGGDSVVKLTDEPNVIHNWGDWSPDENAITFSSNARSQEYFDIYVQDLDDRSKELVYRYDGNAYPVTWSPDGSKILFEVTHAPFDHDLYLLELDDKSADLLTPHSGDAAFYSPTFDEAGRFVYCVTDKDREFAAIARIDVASHELEYLYAEDWDVEGLSATQGQEDPRVHRERGGRVQADALGPPEQAPAGAAAPGRARRGARLVRTTGGSSPSRSPLRPPTPTSGCSSSRTGGRCAAASRG